ncbi:sensor histidine kinase [Clostridium oryzae]|uniref:histidine kinase n=1 Tax=Clostridium oryzae TaxID=1450648 RepID=A0A1V4IVE2_9CLOT|nr:HAMP domain-containing sensor histidine kinase [Clostridium oryzae]OPJ64001.1 signal-transduction histidine kinase senX3 [Clostridium oryzae]
MKINLNILKKKLSIKGFLIINYLVTFLILYLVLQLSYTSSSFISEKFIFKNEHIGRTSFRTYYNKDFNKIKLGFLSDIDGWEEVLDQNKKVIFIKGKKKDNIMKYNEKQLFDLVSINDYSPKCPFVGQVFMVKGKHGEPYIFLYKIDRRKISYSLLYTPNFYTKKDSIFSLKSYGLLYLIQFIYLIIGIYIYSIISSKFITNPLKTFIDSIKSFKKLNYKTRADIKGLRELQEVENEFNEMVLKLNMVEEENKRIDASKKRLLVDVSHDLKTPITSIQGFSKLLLEENITPEQEKKFLKIIYSKAVYSTALIEDLFSLSKLEDSEFLPSLIELDFTEWFRRLVAEYFEEFKNKHFELDLDISEHPVLFKFDEKLMKRAISNIFNNTLTHNEDYTRLKIGCYLKDNNAILEIGSSADIDETIKNTIFEPFVKAESSSSSGSGLGLAITKKIIEKHGGNIKLTSSETEKILFTICIPVKP